MSSLSAWLLVLCAWLTLAGSTWANTQIPIVAGGLRDDERDAVIELIGRPVYPHETGERGPLFLMEFDARLELWVESVVARWPRGAGDPYPTQPADATASDGEAAAREYLRENARMEDRIGRFADFPHDAIRRIMAREWIEAGRLPLPRLKAELLFIVISHRAYCGSAGCDSYLVLQRRGSFTVVGSYRPIHVTGGLRCAIALRSRSNGLHDLLDVADRDFGPARLSWNGEFFQASKLRRAPRTTCCRPDMDARLPSQCPAR